MALAGGGRYGSGETGKTLIIPWIEVWNHPEFTFEIGEEAIAYLEEGKVIIEKKGSTPSAASQQVDGPYTEEVTFQRHKKYERHFYLPLEFTNHELFPLKRADKLWFTGAKTRLAVERLENAKTAKTDTE